MTRNSSIKKQKNKNVNTPKFPLKMNIKGHLQLNWDNKHFREMARIRSQRFFSLFSFVYILTSLIKLNKYKNHHYSQSIF